MKNGIFFLLLFVPIIMVGTLRAAEWKAGVAKVNITPQESLWLAGYAGRDHASEGVLLDLWAKALVLEDAAGNRSVLVTADLLEFPKQMSDSIRKQLHDKFGWDKAQIILNASHTHSGPVLSDSALVDMYLPFNAQEQEKIDRYRRYLEPLIVDMIVEASQSLEPVTLAAANGIARFQVNRRNNAEGKLTAQTELKGPNDFAVPVLKVTDASGQIKAIAFGYACHPTVLSIYLLSGDYPGFAQAELEKLYPGATALFFQGAGADQNPLPRRTIPLAKQYGVTLAAAVDRVLQEEMKVLPPTLKTAYAEVTLPLDTPYSEAYLSDVAKNGPQHLRRYAQRFLQQVQNGETLMSSYPYPVQAWNIGGWPLFTLGGELTLGYAIQLKEKYGEHIFVLGFTNDVMGYIPTLTILKEGGYEGATSQLEYGLPGLWAPEIESVIYEAIDDLVKQAEILPLLEQNAPGWKLVWEENFDKEGVIDEAVWSKIPRGRSDWQRHMSDYEALYDVKDGKLILRGMVNPGLPGDTAPFITGGVYTKDKKGFGHGKIEICAKLGNAQGAWPAFWLLPFDNTGWPHGGEIDIMERLNSDEIAYQTVHSHYTVNLKQNTPQKGSTGPIRKDEYNVYGVELYPDRLVLSINGEKTLTYPRIETELEGQFPFDRPFYLLLDMQLGGSWVGEVNPDDLPVEMSIDWVRFYEWR